MAGIGDLGFGIWDLGGRGERGAGNRGAGGMRYLGSGIPVLAATRIRFAAGGWGDPYNRRMTGRGVLLCVLGVALFASYVYGQQYGVEPAKLELVKLADDLYVIYNEFVPGNTTALITSAGVILVDAKYAIDHAGVMAQLARVTRQRCGTSSTPTIRGSLRWECGLAGSGRTGSVIGACTRADGGQRAGWRD